MIVVKSENVTVEEAREAADKIMEIKGYECIFIDLKDCWRGYSVLVYKNGKPIAYDCEGFHEDYIEIGGRELLRQYYIDEINSTFFTDAELLEDIKTYDEYWRKDNFLRNYWIMQYYHSGPHTNLSFGDMVNIMGALFHSLYSPSPCDEDTIPNLPENVPPYSDLSNCFVTDDEVVKMQEQYHAHLEADFKALKENNDTFREMIGFQLDNCECNVTGEYENALEHLGFTWETLSDEQKQITLDEFDKLCRVICMIWEKEL